MCRFFFYGNFKVLFVFHFIAYSTQSVNFAFRSLSRIALLVLTAFEVLWFNFDFLFFGLADFFISAEPFIIAFLTGFIFNHEPLVPLYAMV